MIIYPCLDTLGTLIIQKNLYYKKTFVSNTVLLVIYVVPCKDTSSEKDGDAETLCPIYWMYFLIKLIINLNSIQRDWELPENYFLKSY